jgi:hypothetical protein
MYKDTMKKVIHLISIIIIFSGAVSYAAQQNQQLHHDSCMTKTYYVRETIGLMSSAMGITQLMSSFYESPATASDPTGIVLTCGLGLSAAALGGMGLYIRNRCIAYQQTFTRATMSAAEIRHLRKYSGIIQDIANTITGVSGSLLAAQISFLVPLMKAKSVFDGIGGLIALGNPVYYWSKGCRNRYCSESWDDENMDEYVELEQNEAIERDNNQV